MLSSSDGKPTPGAALSGPKGYDLFPLGRTRKMGKPAPKGSQRALGHDGSRKTGRKSAYQERVDADFLWDMFTRPMDRDELQRRLRSGRYTIMDVVVSKAYSGNERILAQLLDKLFPGPAAQTVLQVFMNRMGAANEDELKLLVESGRRVESIRRSAEIDLASCRDEAVALLRVVLRERPEWMPAVARELGILTDVDAVQSGNGGSNG